MLAATWSIAETQEEKVILAHTNRDKELQIEVDTIAESVHQVQQQLNELREHFRQPGDAQFKVINITIIDSDRFRFADREVDTIGLKKAIGRIVAVYPASTFNLTGYDDKSPKALASAVRVCLSANAYNLTFETK